MYQFKLPVGDWSGDGHAQCKYYIFKSNKPVEEIREVHFRIIKTTGIDIHKICNDYEQSSLEIDDNVLEKLNEIGFHFSNEEEIFNGSFKVCPDDMMELWIFLLRYTDKMLELNLVVENEIPMLPFYGFDEKKRHIDQVGYGCF